MIVLTSLSACVGPTSFCILAVESFLCLWLNEHTTSTGYVSLHLNSGLAKAPSLTCCRHCSMTLYGLPWQGRGAAAFCFSSGTSGGLSASHS